LLQGTRAVPTLAAGAASSGTTDVVIPPNTPVGSYYVIAKADGNDALVETSETNNTYARSIKLGGDLVVSALTVVAVPGSDVAFTVTDTTANQGSAGIGASITRFYLSPNSTLDASDTPLDGGRSVPALEAGFDNTGNATVTSPAGTPGGMYYLIAKADADALVSETSETNNTLSRSFYVGSDLIVSALTVPAKSGPGATISVTDTTTNNGPGSVGASTTRYYLSANSTWDAGDTPLGDGHAVPALAAGATHSGTITLAIPASTEIGAYYIVAKADADNTVGESKETNNTLAKGIQIGPDLDVSVFTAPSKSGAGLTLAVSDTTLNQGGGSSAPTMTRFYLSTNSSYEAVDTPIGSHGVPTLAAGQASAISTTLTVPSNTATGTYYLIAKADADGVVTETSETNNIYARSIKIGPDLDVTTLTASVSSVVAGGTVTVTDRVLNDGGGSAPVSVTRFYLSTNTALDGGDTLLAASRTVPSLAPGASSSGPTVVVIPAGTSPARYYILAKADGDDAVAETTEGNNVSSRAITVTAP
jgi:subtilase family serine protease